MMESRGKKLCKLALETVQEDESENEKNDPCWLPDSESSSYESPSDYERESSPITNEQLMVATEAIKFVDDLPPLENDSKKKPIENTETISDPHFSDCEQGTSEDEEIEPEVAQLEGGENDSKRKPIENSETISDPHFSDCEQGTPEDEEIEPEVAQLEGGENDSKRKPIENTETISDPHFSDCEQGTPEDEEIEPEVAQLEGGICDTHKLDSKREKIEALRKQIEEWKLKKREALKKLKRSKGRRISQKIKRFKQQLEEIDSLQENDSREKLIGNSETISDPLFSDCEQGVEADEQIEPEVQQPNEGAKTRKSRERKKNYCLYCKKLITNYSRHLETVHPTTEEGSALLKLNVEISNFKCRKLEKQKITSKFKKISNSCWNESIMKEDKNLTDTNSRLIPVKSRHSKTKKSSRPILPTPADSVQCSNCLGLYKRNRLCSHINKCLGITSSPKKSSPKEKRKVLRDHATPLIPKVDNVSEEVKKEILNYMNCDEIGTLAKSDPLILQMGSEFHKSRRDVSEKSYCSREMRDMARLVIEVNKINSNIKQLKDCFNPAYFGDIIRAVELLNGYDPKTGSVKVAGLAYRLLQPLKNCLRLHRKNLIESEYMSNSTDRNQLVQLNDFEQLIKDNWSNQVGRHSLRSLKKGKSLKTPKMALEKDIKTLSGYINSRYSSVIDHLTNHPKDSTVYNELVDMLLSHVMCLARRRPVDLTRGTIDHFSMLDAQDDLVGMIKDKSLSQNDIEQCKKFHIFFVPGKKYDTVPIVFTEPMKKAMELLIKNRNSVGITNSKLFMHTNNKEVEPAQSLERIKKKVVLERPKDLTGNGLRHQAATFSKLHSTHPLYQDHLATTLGHTLYIHKKNYDLPTSIAQKLIVAPVLHKMTSDDRTASSEDETRYLEKPSTSSFDPVEDNNIVRKKWNEEEKKVVYQTFGKEILKGVMPSRNNIVLLKDSCNALANRTLPQVCTFINNAVKRKMSNVSPNVKKYKRN